MNTHEIPDDEIEAEYREVENARANAPDWWNALIDEYDARAEQLAAERDREMATEAYVA